MALALELRDHVLGRVDRHGEADADVAAGRVAGVAIWELIPITRPRASSSGPPELPGLSAASVWITSSIAKPLGAVEPALERGDDAGGERAVEPERVADRDRRVADLHRAGVAQLERPQVEAVRLDAQQREVGVGVLADGLAR